MLGNTQLVGARAELEVHLALDLELERVAFRGAQVLDDGVEVRRGLALDPDDAVAFREARALGRVPLLDAGDEIVLEVDAEQRAAVLGAVLVGERHADGARDRHAHALTRLARGQRALERLEALELVVVEGHQSVAGAQVGGRRRGVRNDLDDVEVVLARERDAEPGAVRRLGVAPGDRRGGPCGPSALQEPRGPRQTVLVVGRVGRRSGRELGEQSGEDEGVDRHGYLLGGYLDGPDPTRNDRGRL